MARIDDHGNWTDSSNECFNFLLRQFNVLFVSFALCYNLTLIVSAFPLLQSNITKKFIGVKVYCNYVLLLKKTTKATKERNEKRTKKRNLIYLSAGNEYTAFWRQAPISVFFLRPFLYHLKKRYMNH